MMCLFSLQKSRNLKQIFITFHTLPTLAAVRNIKKGPEWKLVVYLNWALQYLENAQASKV